MFNINEKRQQLRNLGKRASEDLAPKGKEITPEAIGQAIAAQLAPALDSIHRAIASINIQFPDLRLPAPIVNVAPAQVHIPETKFPEQMHTQSTLAGVDKDRPLPVIMMDQAGKPFVFNFGSSGGKSDFFTIKDIRSSTASLIDQTENALRVTGNFASNSDLGPGAATSTTLRVVHATDVALSTQITDINGEQLELYNAGGAARVGIVVLDEAGQPIQATNPFNVVPTFGGAELSDSNPMPMYLAADSNYTVGVVTINPDGNPVYGGSSGGGLTDAELRATAVPISQVSGANWSVNVVSGGGAGTQYTEDVTYDERITYTAIGFNDNLVGDPTAVDYSNPLPVFDEDSATSLQFLRGALETEGGTDVLMTRQVSGAADSVNVVTTVGLTDTQLRATAVPVSQVSGANWSVFVTGGAGTQYTNEITYDEPLTANAVGYLGADGLFKAVTEDANHLPVYDFDVALNTLNLSEAVESVGSEVLRVRQVSGASDSVFVTGSADSMMTYEARQTNPTAKSDGADVRPKTDDLGRILTRPIQVRDLITTARVAKTSGSTFGTETTLLAASAGVYKDLIYVLATNDSTAAITCDFRSVTAGNVLFTLRIPANGSTGMALPVPIPQDATGNNWTIDLDDVTGTNVTVSALFTTEI